MFKKEEFLKSVKDYCPNTKVLYDRNNIVLVQVESFADCHFLFDKKTIDWCIARSNSHWCDYVAKPFHKQYFIVDFNHINDENHGTEYNRSLIGFTTKRGDLYAAHARNDANLLSESDKKYNGLHPFEKILKDKGLYDFVIKNGFKDKPSLFDSGMWLFWLLVLGILLCMTSMFFRWN